MTCLVCGSVGFVALGVALGVALFVAFFVPWTADPGARVSMPGGPIICQNNFLHSPSPRHQVPAVRHLRLPVFVVEQAIPRDGAEHCKHQHCKDDNLG